MHAYIYDQLLFTLTFACSHMTTAVVPLCSNV